ncbi:MAG: hypothetical protein K6A36_05315 [Paludibacteraceae bacterium]|nr:hypothetical protein [Paludibacteraceae bacterium]
MKKLMYLLTLLCLVACNGNQPTEPTNEDPANYVDLGLPSGTLWKSVNELNYPNDTSFYFLYTEAVDTFKANMPTVQQWKELADECTWIWKKEISVLNKDSVWVKFPGYKIIGLNGDSIFLPAMGGRSVGGDICYAGTHGEYWSNDLAGSDGAKGFSFNSDSTYMGYYLRKNGLCVRLVMPALEPDTIASDTIVINDTIQ